LEKICNSLGIEVDVLLFGSVLIGAAGVNSDLDIAIGLKEEIPLDLEKKLQKYLDKKASHPNFPVGINILSPSEFKRMSIGYEVYQKYGNEFSSSIGSIICTFANIIGNIRDNLSSEIE